MTSSLVFMLCQESVSEVGAGPANEVAASAFSAQAPAPSRPASPAPSASAPSAQPPDDMRAKLSLPPGVMRRAQQLPGAIPLPNGHQVRHPFPSCTMHLTVGDRIQHGAGTDQACLEIS